jgi:hypothetical protein
VSTIVSEAARGVEVVKEMVAVIHTSHFTLHTLHNSHFTLRVRV